MFYKEPSVNSSQGWMVQCWARTVGDKENQMDFKMEIHECGFQITDVFPEKQSNKQMFPSKLRLNMCILLTVRSFPIWNLNSFQLQALCRQSSW